MEKNEPFMEVTQYFQGPSKNCPAGFTDWEKWKQQGNGNDQTTPKIV